MKIVPPVVRIAVVDRPIGEAFSIFTDEIGAWWPLPTHSVFGADSGGLHFHDGKLIERSTDGRSVVWGEVTDWKPPHRVALTWHPGEQADQPAGLVEVTFAEEGDATRVQIRHDGWEAFGAQALERRRSYAGPSAWGHVLDHFSDGAERRLDAADLETLVAAYDAFFAEAERGEFGAPGDDAWSAEYVVAHVAANDLAMTAIHQGIVHRGEVAFRNQVCQQPEVIDRIIETVGDFEGLIAFGRQCAEQMMAAARRLDSDQRQTLVHCTLENDGEIVLDAPMPWGQISIEIQAGRHLPAHTEQLRDLRA